MNNQRPKTKCRRPRVASIRRNKSKEKLQNGEIVTVISGLQSSDIIDFLGPIGFDAAWIECEHGSVDWDSLGDMTRACDLWEMASITRVNSNDPGLITRTLDRGSMGIVVPHVNSKEAAERAAQSTKYAPLGYRGMFGGRQSFGVSDYFHKANDQTMVVVLLEEIEALANLDEIIKALDNSDINLHSKIIARVKNFDSSVSRVETTPGRMLLGELLPYNEKIDFSSTFEGPQNEDSIFDDLIQNAQDDSPYIENFGAFYPNFHLTYKFGGGDNETKYIKDTIVVLSETKSHNKSIQFGLSRRVNRPGGGGRGHGSWQIMPFPRNIYNDQFIFVVFKILL